MGKVKIDVVNGKLKVQKSYEELSSENAELAKKLDYITKEELIEAVKKIAKIVGIDVSFTFDNLKKDLR